MRRLVRHTSRAVQGSLVVLGVAVAWLSLVASLVTWTVAPMAAGWRPYVVMSDSMRPTVAAGDVVLVTRDTGPRPLRPGDVALVADADRPAGTRLHRFVELDDEGRVVTRGDANASPDAPSPATDVIGRARILVPGIGLPALWLHRGQLVPAVAAAVATFAALWVVLGPGAAHGAAPAPRPRPRPRRGPARARHARAPERRAQPVGAFAALLVVVVVVVQPAAPGWARYVATATNGGSSVGAGAWMGYTWTVTNDGAPASWWRLNESGASTVATPATGAISGTYYFSPSKSFVSAAGVNTAVPPAAPTRDGAQSMLYTEKVQGSNKYQNVAFGDNYDFTGRTPFSVEIWFKQTATCASCFQRVVSKEYFTLSPVTHTGWFLAIFPPSDANIPGSLGFVRVLDSTFTNAPTPTALTLNTWYHAVGTYDGNDLRLYLNGELVSMMPSTVSLRDNAQPLRVGDRDVSTGERLSGHVDEFAIYTTVLTPRQVRAHYLAGSPAG